MMLPMLRLWTAPARRPRMLMLSWIVSACCLGVTPAASAGESTVPNGSFEAAAGDRPEGWRGATWGGKGTFEHAALGRTGARSVSLASADGADVSWTTTAAIDPFARYRLSAWIRTEKVEAGSGRGALLNLHDYQPLATSAVTGTKDWTRVELEFDSEDRDSVQVNCLLGGWGLSTGKAWYDDLVLEKIAPAKDWKPFISIDASRTGEPISKYVYGQFIEHLGRCIYGGIWAEMLEDRKFFEPVGARGSAWKAVGGADAVTMVREGAFVGAHTPAVALRRGELRGIAQAGLGLVAGKRYVGRVWLAGTPAAGPVKVSLIWGGGAGDRGTVLVENAGGEFAKSDLEFTAGSSTDDGRLEILAEGEGNLRIGTVSLMPADNVQGMRADTLGLLRELDSPVYRWPGGNFVSGYDWRDGIGPRDRRPPRKNPAWTGIEHNDFGLDEFMVFCRLLKTDPYIAVNSGLGDVKDAVEEVEYANGSVETPMGKLRAANGHPEPYGVKYWSIGNEMYGGWQLGHMPLEKYTEKHNTFAKAMRGVDPSISLIAVGDAGPWSRGMMRSCADAMDLISEHFYCQERSGLSAHVSQIPAAVRAKAEAHRRYRQELDSLKGKDIRIALDEWNYWYGPHLYGELGTRYFLKDALGIAAGINEMARQSDMIFMANYAQTVNVIGCIKTTKTAAAFDTTGLVLKLYRKQFGTIPVTTTSARLIDAQAAWSADRKTLTLAVVNATRQPVDIALEVKGAKLTGSGTRWEVTGPDPMSYNEPGKPPAVSIEEKAVSGLSDKVSVAPCSVTLLALAAE